MRMNSLQIEDFIGFGFTIKCESNKDDNKFKGHIHRFIVFCDRNNGIPTYVTIGSENYYNLTKFYKRYQKLQKNTLYKEYNSGITGEPDLNWEEIKEARFSL